MKRFGPYLIFIAAMLWATDAPFRVALLKDLPAGLIVLLEHFVDILVILPVLFYSRRELGTLKKKDWLALLFIGVCGSALASVAFTQAFAYVSPSVAILLQKLQPIIAISLASLMLKETLGPKFWLWAILGILGAYLISFPEFKPQVYPGEVLNFNLIGLGLALLAAIFWGASTVLGKYVLKDASFRLVTSLRFLIAFIFLSAMNSKSLNLETLASITPKNWLYILVVALASGVFSLFLYYKGLQYTKASVATIAELGFPLAAVLVNYFVLKVELSQLQTLGMFILLFAVMQLAKHNFQTEIELNLAKT